MMKHARRRGFSLVELLVCVLIVGLLAALALPSLSRARDRARDAVSLSNLRSHATILAMYTSEWEGAFPCFADPAAKRTLVHVKDDDYLELRYWLTWHYWQFVLAEDYYESRVLPGSMMRPGAGYNMSYAYSCSFLAAPEYWRDRAERPRRLWRGTRESELLFPSQKAVLVEFEPGTPYRLERFDRRPLLMSFVDPSAAGVGEADLMTPVLDGEGTELGTFHHIGVYGMHTVDGLRGRDAKQR
ncbi:MAG: type II secretion system protein [Phycisphaerales bacterium]|nr:type II secretion system protein [Phycisphaerales bacterium]